jgi:hypothetical protein
MKRSLGTSLKKMGRDASNKYEKHWANKRVRKIANDLSMETGVVGKPAVKQKKLFIIEEREYIDRNSMWWSMYAKRGQRTPFWTDWKKHKAYSKISARNRALEQVIRLHKIEQTKYSYKSDKEFRAVDLKK